MVNDVFSALAHPVRRGIVERLAHGPATVGIATRGFGVTKPAITRHLRVLESGGVVVRTVEGRTHRLGLNVAALRDTADWLERQRALWERMFDAVEEQLRTQSDPTSGRS
jgi:DNA-binding transcriptional ArsR family regulator